MKLFKYLLLSILLSIAMVTPVAASDPIAGKATWYECTKGWCDGTPTVALAGFLGGRYTGHINGYVEVCGNRCVTLPSVDYCQCYEGTADQRIVDLNKAAWPLVTDSPYSTGKITVSMTIMSGTVNLPDTSLRGISIGTFLTTLGITLIFVAALLAFIYFLSRTRR